MKKTIITSLFILLSSCSTPQIKYHSNGLFQITMQDKVIVEAQGKLIYKSRVNLNRINIQQNIYKMENENIVIYEDALVSTGYKFSYGIGKTIGLIFPDYNYKLLDTKGNLHFFKLVNEHDSEYLILENINKKRVKMIYGLEKSLFYMIYNKLINNKILLSNEKTTLKNKIIMKDKSVYIKSRWNTKNIILDTIIMKEGSSRIKM